MGASWPRSAPTGSSFRSRTWLSSWSKASSRPTSSKRSSSRRTTTSWRSFLPRISPGRP